MHLKKIKIKNLELSGNLFLSPMAGITNYAFRKICLENGCSMVFTEMVSAQSLARGNLKTLRIAKVLDDKPVCEQIFGNDENIMKEAAIRVEELGADMIEINSGCPVKKIVKSGCGSALMKNPYLLYRIIEAVAKSVKIPVSVKIRPGFSQGEDLISHMAPNIEKSGADCLHIHLRSVSQVHSGPVDWQIGAKLKKIINIPVIVNGGITDHFKAKEMFEKTDADAVSVGRGAVMNPMIFTQIKKYMQENQAQNPTHKQRAKLFMRFLQLNCAALGEEKGLVTARKLVGLWLKNFDNASMLRSEFMKIKTLEDARALFSGI